MPKTSNSHLPDLLMAQQQLRFASADPRSLRRCPKVLRPLIRESHSLTRALRHTLGDDLEIQLLRQSWHFFAGSTIQSPNRHFMLARRMRMSHRGDDVLDALSLLPVNLLNARHRSLRQLGNRALGDSLFSGPATAQRSPIQVAHDHTHWWRRSHLHIDGGSIFLIERFPRAFWHDTESITRDPLNRLNDL